MRSALVYPVINLNPTKILHKRDILIFQKNVNPNISNKSWLRFVKFKVF